MSDLREIKELLLRDDATLADAIGCIDRNWAKIALITDAAQRLVGTVTDGDIRRGLLRGHTLSAPVATVMNCSPLVLHQPTTQAQALDLMRRHGLRQVPILDAQGRPVEVELMRDHTTVTQRKNLVVVMAGGEGRRLRPLTDQVPKPMIDVGGRPILETITQSLASQGFGDFLFSVNYRAEIIKAHFGHGKRHGVSIRYLEENEPLGTAGSLRLLPHRPKEPFIVTNGDVLTTLSYADLLEAHAASNALITLCVQPYQHAVPFGLVSLDGSRVTGLQEKPTLVHPVNSGIYVLSPPALDLLPPDGMCDMTTLIQAVLDEGGIVSAFFIREYWMDVGRPMELEQARSDYDHIFNQRT
ncbi:nucleotidyltransferase family protein [Niveispirillum fermenti]|uniref:nucleotidyltransferase family protein n=1 Tax=Niveispirillum fermenti TaxID=1233113 RepID=UPI003A8424DB